MLVVTKKALRSLQSVIGYFGIYVTVLRITPSMRLGGWLPYL